MDWSTKSLDLNPIENLWGILSRRVNKNKCQFEDRETLKLCIKQYWNEIPSETLRKLIDSIQNNWVKVLQLKGNKCESWILYDVAVKYKFSKLSYTYFHPWKSIFLNFFWWEVVIKSDMYINTCDVVCYQEREREVDSPTLLCLNQQASRLKRQIRTKVNSSHTMTCHLLNKEWNPGPSGIMIGFNGGRKKKSNDWPIGPLASKWHFFVRENLEKNLQFEDRGRQIKMPVYSQILRGPSPAKRIFSSRQTLAKDRCQFSHLWESPVKRVEQNLWTEVSIRKTC